MQNYHIMSKSELQDELQSLQARYENIRSLHLALDMTRGKPCADQLDLSMGLLSRETTRSKAGADCRNYGILDGLPEMKKLFAELLGVSENEVFVGGNSSLNLMHDLITNALLMGVGEGKTPWSRQGKLKFLCPVPGYDRHFAITEKFGFEMIPVPTNEHGPVMDTVEELVKDPSVKGIWCVPKYANPTGITYSDEVVRRFAALKPAADDFRIFWDNAYAIHDLNDTPDTLLNIFDVCKEQGSEDMVYEFFSTSKISFPGAGVACFAASEHNLAWLKKQFSVQTIGYDKLNQLRHLDFFNDADGVREQMQKHKALIAPKFALVLDILDKSLSDAGIASWTKPNGGYFISFDEEGCASRIISLAAEAGLKITPAGSTYPYHRDPEDKNLRIAPTLPETEDLKKAAELFCLCARIAAIEKILTK